VSGRSDVQLPNFGRTGKVFVVQKNGWTISKAVPAGSDRSVAHDLFGVLNDAG
jgi:hypothetical protein